MYWFIMLELEDVCFHVT